MALRRRVQKYMKRRELMDVTKHISASKRPKVIASVLKNYQHLLAPECRNSDEMSSPQFKFDRPFCNNSQTEGEEDDNDKHFQLCILRGHEGVWASGDLVEFAPNSHGIVQYFHSKCKVRVRLCLHRQELCKVWLPYLERGLEFFPTDNYQDIVFAEVLSCKPVSPHQVSSFGVKIGRILHGAAMPDLAEVLCQTYLMVPRRKLLEKHPLLVFCADFMGYNVSRNRKMLLQWLKPKRDWGSLRLQFENDQVERDSMCSNTQQFASRVDGMEGVCDICYQQTRLHFQEDAQLCPECYVRVRKIYRVLRPLERMRTNHKSQQGLPALQVRLQRFLKVVTESSGDLTPFLKIH